MVAKPPHEPIHNLYGAPGAWLADTLFFILAYGFHTIPVIIVGGCWFAWRHQSTDDYIDILLCRYALVALALTSPPAVWRPLMPTISGTLPGGAIGSLLHHAAAVVA
ncbi:DNA translocase FtsK 4TM domain-containing protein [Salmonella enterica subsp. enterica]|nr:DNA translocase FtsK 4TM domain-containing protein [Salmonella enterica subsp. enterica]